MLYHMNSKSGEGTNPDRVKSRTKYRIEFINICVNGNPHHARHQQIGSV